jgi:hypothetical protein
MRHVRNIAAVLMMLASVVGSGHGQAGAPGIKVTVPFRFVIERTTFSSGDYLMFSSRDKVWVQEASGRTVAVVVTDALDGRVPEYGGRVIFDCYVSECFLSRVWVAGQDAGRTLPKPKREIQLARTGAGQQFSLLGSKPKR